MRSSRVRVLARNIVSNWMGFAVNVAVTLLLTPYVLQELGDARYGVWALTISLTGYYGLLDLGFSGGVTQFLTRYLAKRDFENFNRSLSSAVLALSGVGALILCGSLAVAWFAPVLLDLPEGLEYEVFWCVVIIGASAALQSALFGFSAVFTATQRFDASNAIGIATRLLKAALVVWALSRGYGLIGLSLATAGANTVDYLLRWRLARYLLPELEVSPRLANLGSCKEIMSFGSWNFLIAVSGTALIYADSLIVGLFLPVAALAPFSLAANLSRYLSGMLLPVNQVFFPAATELHAQNQRDTLRRMYLEGSRLYVLLALVMCTVTSIWAEDFFRLWVGDRFVSGEEYPSVAVLYCLLVGGVAGTALPGIGGQLLLGARRVKPLAILAICEAIAHVVSSVVLVQKFGLIGVAVGGLASVIVFRTIPVPVLVGREINVSWREYLLESGLRPVLACLVLVGPLLVLAQHSAPETMIALAFYGLISFAIALPVALAIGTNAAERHRFLYGPLRRLAHRMGILDLVD